MKWQKNTGVMPCDRRNYVSVKFPSGKIDTGRALVWDWHLKGTQSDITHYCILDVPLFDYVEPKVWTMRDDRVSDRAQLYRHKLPAFSIYYTDARRASINISELIDALNQMEERNGTK